MNETNRILQAYFYSILRGLEKDGIPGLENRQPYKDLIEAWGYEGCLNQLKSVIDEAFPHPEDDGSSVEVDWSLPWYISYMRLARTALKMMYNWGCNVRPNSLSDDESLLRWVRLAVVLLLQLANPDVRRVIFANSDLDTIQLLMFAAAEDSLPEVIRAERELLAECASQFSDN